MATGSINIGGSGVASNDDITRIKYDLWISDIQKYGKESRIYKDSTKMALLREDGDIYNDPICAETVKALTKIEITTNPTKTEYVKNSTFDPTGMVVTATFTNGSTAEVTEYTVDKTTLVLGDTTVTVSYTYEGVIKTADVAITVINYVVDVENLSVGDEITITHDVYGDVPFIVIGKNHDGEGTATILSKEILQLLSFDAKEANNTDSNRKSYGNNRYLYSNLLQWMNSEAEAGQWYTAQHSADQSPNSTDVVSYNPYADKPGFLHGFSDDFKRQLVTVNKTTAKNTVTDGGGSEIVSSKAFLLSTTEVGLANENSIAEGTIYEYFSQNNTNEQRIAYPSTYCLNNAGGYTNTDFAEGKGWHYWLRAPLSSYSYNERLVSTSGALGNSYASVGGIGLRVGLTIANQ